MAKKRIEKPKRKPTKRQLSRWQKQKRRQRLIVSIGTSVVIIALGLLVAGIYFQWYLPQEKPFKETVVEVNDTLLLECSPLLDIDPEKRTQKLYLDLSHFGSRHCVFPLLKKKRKQ